PALDAGAELALALAGFGGVHRLGPHPDGFDPARRSGRDRASVHRTGIHGPGPLAEFLRRGKRLAAIGRTGQIEVAGALDVIPPHDVQRAVRCEGDRRVAALAHALLGRAVDAAIGLPGRAAVERAGAEDLG